MEFENIFSVIIIFNKVYVKTLRRKSQTWDGMQVNATCLSILTTPIFKTDLLFQLDKCEHN